MNQEEIKTQVLTENTAQAVFKHLNDLESNRARVLTRWVWELLQNARDTSRNTDTKLIASIEYTDGEIVFQHNGAKFENKEVTHLIYSGSTKTEDEAAIGQYGSGFLDPQFQKYGELLYTLLRSFQSISSYREWSCTLLQL